MFSINRIHTLNGLLLKPTVPATAIDAQIYQVILRTPPPPHSVI